MKSIFTFSRFVALSILAFSSCTRHSGTRTTSAHYISASISGGGSFYTTDPNINTGGSVGGNVKIDGVMSTSGPQLEFSFLAYPGTTGTYSLGLVSVEGSYHAAADIVSPESVHGTLTLTAVTPNIVGTFSFTRADSSVVSGSMNVPAP
jgi:hypothetical protein